MALTSSPKAELGSRCPDFNTLAVDGQNYQLDSFSQADLLLVMFICNHCPYVKAIEERIIELQYFFTENNSKYSVQLLGVCSNDANEYPDDSFQNLKKSWSEKKYNFPYLYDEDQSMAKKFSAVCTPDFFLYNKNRQLIYRGRLDDSWKNSLLVKDESLKNFIFLASENPNELNISPNTEQHPTLGCSIKWKSESLI